MILDIGTTVEVKPMRIQYLPIGYQMSIGIVIGIKKGLFRTRYAIRYVVPTVPQEQLGWYKSKELAELHDAPEHTEDFKYVG